MTGFWYVASPYTHTDADIMHERYGQAVRGLFLLHTARPGEVFYSPIVHWHVVAVRHVLPADHEFWEHQDNTMMDLSKGMIVLTLDGWLKSRGVAREIGYMKHQRKPIEYFEVPR